MLLYILGPCYRELVKHSESSGYRATIYSKYLNITKPPSQDFCNFTQFLCLFRLCHCRYFWSVTGLHRLHWLQECLLLSVLCALLFMIVLDLQPPAYLVKPWVNCGTSSLTTHGMIMFIDFHKFDTSCPPEQWHDHPIRRETTGPLWCHQAAEAA